MGKCTPTTGRVQRLLAAACICVSAVVPVPAHADPDDWLDNPQTQTIDAPASSFVAQPSVSAAQAAAHVRRLHGGRVLSVSPSRRGDSLGYRVRVLVDGGRVKTVYVDSGRANGAAPANPAVRTIGDR